MFRFLLPAIIAIGIAFGLGAWSADQVTNDFRGFSTIKLDGWTAQLQNGGGDTDPYLRASIARSGELALGDAEGLRFTRLLDDDEDRLHGACDYQITDLDTDARAWALSAIASRSDADVRSRKTIVTSGTAIAFDNAPWMVLLSSSLKPGVWASPPAENEFDLELILIDTSIGTSLGISTPSLPSVTKLGCRDG
ncbi:MAG: hypothetical protein AAGI92_06485 [Pseudomonadota bacterium]